VDGGIGCGQVRGVECDSGVVVCSSNVGGEDWLDGGNALLVLGGLLCEAEDWLCGFVVVDEEVVCDDA